MLAVLNLTFLNHYWFRQPPTSQWQAGKQGTFKTKHAQGGGGKAYLATELVQSWVLGQKFPSSTMVPSLNRISQLKVKGDCYNLYVNLWLHWSKCSAPIEAGVWIWEATVIA